MKIGPVRRSSDKPQSVMQFDRRSSFHGVTVLSKTVTVTPCLAVPGAHAQSSQQARLHYMSNQCVQQLVRGLWYAGVSTSPAAPHPRCTSIVEASRWCVESSQYYDGAHIDGRPSRPVTLPKSKYVRLVGGFVRRYFGIGTWGGGGEGGVKQTFSSLHEDPPRPQLRRTRAAPHQRADLS